MTREELELWINNQFEDMTNPVAASFSTREFMEKIDEYHKPKKTKKSLEERKEKFKEKLKPHLEKYGRVALNKFYSYWTEHGDNDKKMRFEKETSWSLSSRLVRWKGNGNDDGDNKFEAKTEEYNK